MQDDSTGKFVVEFSAYHGNVHPWHDVKDSCQDPHDESWRLPVFPLGIDVVRAIALCRMHLLGLQDIIPYFDQSVHLHTGSRTALIKLDEADEQASKL